MARMGEGKAAYRVLVRRPGGKRPLGKPRRRWENNNIKIYLQEVGWGGMDWIDPAEDRDRWWTLVNALQQNAGNSRLTCIRSAVCDCKCTRRVVPKLWSADRRGSVDTLM